MTPPDEIQALVERLQKAHAFMEPFRESSLMLESADALERLSAENARLAELGGALVRKLDQVSADTAGIFTMAAMHGYDYRGAHYDAELEAIRAALAKLEAQPLQRREKRDDARAMPNT